MTKPLAALTLPSALERLRAHVLEDVHAGDVSGQDVLDTLTIAWVAAERWRVEQITENDEPLDEAPMHARGAGA